MKSVKSLLDKVRKVINGNATATQASLIHKLNPIIRGWAMYHRHVVAKATFSLVDDRIWRMLRKWACRRHPNKGARWEQSKYYRIYGNRNGEFGTEDTKDRLFRAATVSIRRHIKIRAPASPFDPVWHEYFAHRRATKSAVE